MRNDKVAILIKRTALVVEKLANHMLAPYDLTNTQYKILKFLYQHPNGSMRQADIEKKYSMTNPTVTGIIQNLERKGLVHRVRNPDDRRSHLLVLTDEALSIKDQLYALGESIEEQVTRNLTNDECEQLSALLNKILEND